MHKIALPWLQLSAYLFVLLFFQTTIEFFHSPDISCFHKHYLSAFSLLTIIIRLIVHSPCFRSYLDNSRTVFLLENIYCGYSVESLWVPKTYGSTAKCEEFSLNYPHNHSSYMGLWFWSPPPPSFFPYYKRQIKVIPFNQIRGDL